MFPIGHIAGVACTGSAILASWSCNAGGYYLMSCHLPTDRSRHALQRFPETKAAVLQKADLSFSVTLDNGKFFVFALGWVAMSGFC